MPTPTRDQTCPGMCPDWELNPHPLGVKTTLHPTEPHWPGLHIDVFIEADVSKFPKYTLIIKQPMKGPKGAASSANTLCAQPLSKPCRKFLSVTQS